MRSQEIGIDQFIRKAVSSLPTGMFVCDREGVVLFINDAYALYLGLQADMIVGRNITELIPDSGIPDVIASGQPQLGVLRQFDKGKTTLLVNRVPIFDDSGTVIGAVSLTLVDTPEQVQALVHRVEALDKKVTAYARRMKSALQARYTVDSILGTSDVMTVFKSFLQRYARTDSPVLLLGATGTGKELAASAIHMASPRRDGPFVSINCAAIPKDLFESEVFGYVPGAFSGAHKDGKVGQVELADQGTLFLDEVGDLPMHAQVKLLRVLEEKRVCRLGASEPRAVDFRLVAATNRDLKAMIGAGRFREDLYYRINPMTLSLPPLCERSGDIPLIVRDILNRMGGENLECSPEAMQTLMHYTWPGNIRELRNTITRALSLCQNGQITLADLPAEVFATPQTCPHSGAQTAAPLTTSANPAAGPFRAAPRIPLQTPELAPAAPAGLHNVVSMQEARAITEGLHEHGWNVAATAKALGISRATMYEKMRKFGIRRERE